MLRIVFLVYSILNSLALTDQDMYLHTDELQRDVEQDRTSSAHFFFSVLTAKTCKIIIKSGG